MRYLNGLFAGVLAVLFVASCSGGGGSGGTGSGTPSGPAVITLSASAGDSQVTFTFNSISGATGYTLYYSTTAGVTTTTGTNVPMPSSPFTLPGMTNGVTYYAIATYTDATGESAPSSEVSATPSTTPSSPYDPSWAGVTPTSTVPYTGTAGGLEAAMNALTAGQKLEIASGTYNLTSKFNLDIAGTAGAPIWICPASGASVVINMTATQNIMNVGENSLTQYVCIRGIEFTGTSHGIRFYDCSNVWLDQCHIHNTGDAALTTNTRDTSNMYITRNEINNTAGTGEGMYLGANNGTVKMSNSVIALNHVHDTNVGVSQGDGIEVKQGSFGNLIAENHVHDCNYPCILVYGTAGAAQNIVERNVCYNSNDNVMQIQGECIVRNNLCINAGGSAFASQPHQGNPVNIQVVNNTFVNQSGRAAKLSTWASASNMVFANNACYSSTSWAIEVTGGNTGITFAGNVGTGSVTTGVGGFTTGTGLSDFANLSWNAANRDATPSGGSPLLAAASATYAPTNDLNGTTRSAPHDTGAVDG